MIALALLLLQTSQAPVLAFPEAGRGRHRRLSGIPDALLPRLERQHRADLSRAARGPGGQPLGRCRRREPRLHRPRCRRTTGSAGVAGRQRGDGRLRRDADARVPARDRRPERDARLVPARLDAGRARLSVRQAAPPAVRRARVPRGGGVAAGGQRRPTRRARAGAAAGAPPRGQRRRRFARVSCPRLTGACSAASCGCASSAPPSTGGAASSLELGVDPARGQHAASRPHRVRPLPVAAAGRAHGPHRHRRGVAHAARARLDLQPGVPRLPRRRAEPRLDLGGGSPAGARGAERRAPELGAEADGRACPTSRPTSGAT